MYTAHSQRTIEVVVDQPKGDLLSEIPMRHLRCILTLEPGVCKARVDLACACAHGGTSRGASS